MTAAPGVGEPAGRQRRLDRQDGEHDREHRPVDRERHDPDQHRDRSAEDGVDRAVPGRDPRVEDELHQRARRAGRREQPERGAERREVGVEQVAEQPRADEGRRGAGQQPEAGDHRGGPGE
jgi:hypothetical protein